MKTFIIRLGVLLLLVFSSGEAYSTVYYVSATGNDNNNGTSTSTPWKTIDKVNANISIFGANDQILFKCGDTFFGSILRINSGTGNALTFGKYGTGNLPVITGKKLFTVWTPYPANNNIYFTTYLNTDTIGQLYVNGNLMPIARYPNSGFFKIDNVSGNTGIIDADLNQSANYWVGANVRIRTANYAYETRVVSASNNGSITFPATQYQTGAGYGYFLDNKFEELDSPNEWYCDTLNRKIYFYPPTGININSLTIEATAIKRGIVLRINKSNTIIQDLNITGYSEHGIYGFGNNDNTTITRCTITRTGKNAIRIGSGKNGFITNNMLDYNLGNGISGTISGGQISNNNINRTGLFAGYGESGHGGYGGIDIYFSSRDLILENNIIDSTGYSAMSVGKNLKIRNNYINYSLLTLNDGAGIDIQGGFNLQTADTMEISNNVILNTIGNIQSSGNPEPYGSGIYCNATVLSHSLIQKNTCAFNSYAGIYFDHKNTPVFNQITGNTLFNNFFAQIIFSDYSAASNVSPYNTVTKKNIFYCLSGSQYTMLQRTYTGNSYNDYGTFDSNYYCNPYSEASINKTKYPAFASINLSLPSWTATTGKDVHSKPSLISSQQYGVSDTVGGNLITNSTFTNPVILNSQWRFYPGGSNSGISRVTHPLLDTGCMRIRWNDYNLNGISLTMSNTYTIQKDAYYIVSLSNVSSYSGSFNLWGLDEANPNFYTFPQTFFGFDNYRKEAYMIYKADTTISTAKLAIGLLQDSLLYVDNVKSYQVHVVKFDSSKISKIFINEDSISHSYSLNGIPYKDLDGIPVTGSIFLPPFSSKILVNDAYLPSRDLYLKAFIEGRYNNINPNHVYRMLPDTVSVYLRAAGSPFDFVDSSKAVLDSNGNGAFKFRKALNSVGYFLVVKHRNSIETWSSSPVNFTSDELSYDFTTSETSAFENNLTSISGKFCIFSGDLDNNGLVDLSDLTRVFNQASNFASGYVLEDITGDNTVDLSDITFVFNNSSAFVGKKTPGP